MKPKPKNTITYRFIIFLFALSSYSFHADGQSYFSTKGTDFWLGFMQNFVDSIQTPPIPYHSSANIKMAVYITTDNLPATGTVSVPLKGWSQSYSVPPNSTTEIDIPVDTVMCNNSDTIENKAVHVISDVPVSVYQLNYAIYSSDAAIIIPTLSLGTSYRAMSYDANGGSFETSELLIVAAYDRTAIKITPTCATMGPGGNVGHPENKPYTITLNQGEVYQLQAYKLLDLTGSLIELDTTASDNCKKFAVFSGNICANVPSPLDSFSCNHLCEEMMPIKTWVTQYITVPFKTRKNDRFRIIASHDGTIVNLDGSLLGTLNAGNYFEYIAGTATTVNANFPVSIAQYSESQVTDGNSDSDPFMIMLQPPASSSGKIVFNAFSTSVIHQYYLNIVTKTANTGLLSLDGIILPDSSFTEVPFIPDYSFASLDLTQGNHILASDSGYTANVYGFGIGSSWGYIAGSTYIDTTIGYKIIDTKHNISANYYNFTDTIFKGASLQFEAFSNPLITSYSWNFGDGSSEANNQTTTHTYGTAGTYKLTFHYQTNKNCGVDSIIWYINVNNSTSVSNYNKSQNYINIYPNPSNDIVTIDLKGYAVNNKTMLELYSITGELIKAQPVHNALSQLNISDLPEGVYIIKVISDTSVVVKRIVKE